VEAQERRSLEVVVLVVMPRIEHLEYIQCRLKYKALHGESNTTRARDISTRIRQYVTVKHKHIKVYYT